MSRTTLLERLVDDAAVFPPGLSPLARAVPEHLDLRSGPYAAHLGPLLVPASEAGRLRALVHGDDRVEGAPLVVGLVARPGDPTEPVAAAVAALRDDERVVVAGVEVGWSPHWRSVLELGVPVAVEVGLGRDLEAGLDDIAAAVDDEADVVAKFRTGATASWAWPDETVLGAFLDAVVLHGLPFKLTGGLHHALRGEYDGHPGHGVVNVLLAVHEALDGAEAPELAGLLGQRSAELLVPRLAALTEVEAARLRGTFRSFGCCGVLDPLGELEALGLLGGAPA